MPSLVAVCLIRLWASLIRLPGVLVTISGHGAGENARSKKITLVNPSTE